MDVPLESGRNIRSGGVTTGIAVTEIDEAGRSNMGFGFTFSSLSLPVCVNLRVP
jgi:hypothetical protein